MKKQLVVVGDVTVGIVGGRFLINVAPFDDGTVTGRNPGLELDLSEREVKALMIAMTAATMAEATLGDYPERWSVIPAAPALGAAFAGADGHQYQWDGAGWGVTS